MSNDLLSNLFLGYRACKDNHFVEYIERKEEQYEEGENITAETALQNHRWCEQTKEQKEILALRAEVTDLKKKIKPKSQTGSNSDGKNKRKSDSNKDKKKKGKKENPKDAWMTVPPKKGEPLEKTHNGKDWKWCSYHKRWGSHKVDTCRAKQEGQTEKPKPKTGGSKDADSKIRLAENLQAIVEEKCRQVAALLDKKASSSQEAREYKQWTLNVGDIRSNNFGRAIFGINICHYLVSCFT